VIWVSRDGVFLARGCIEVCVRCPFILVVQIGAPPAPANIIPLVVLSPYVCTLRNGAFSGGETLTPGRITGDFSCLLCKPPELRLSPPTFCPQPHNTTRRIYSRSTRIQFRSQATPSHDVGQQRALRLTLQGTSQLSNVIAIVALHPIIESSAKSASELHQQPKPPHPPRHRPHRPVLAANTNFDAFLRLSSGHPVLRKRIEPWRAPRPRSAAASRV
jgi:hypothetical protein